MSNTTWRLIDQTVTARGEALQRLSQASATQEGLAGRDDDCAGRQFSEAKAELTVVEGVATGIRAKLFENMRQHDKDSVEERLEQTFRLDGAEPSRARKQARLVGSFVVPSADIAVPVVFYNGHNNMGAAVFQKDPPCPDSPVARIRRPNPDTDQFDLRIAAATPGSLFQGHRLGWRTNPSKSSLRAPSSMDFAYSADNLVITDQAEELPLQDGQPYIAVGEDAALAALDSLAGTRSAGPFLAREIIRSRLGLGDSDSSTIGGITIKNFELPYRDAVRDAFLNRNDYREGTTFAPIILHERLAVKIDPDAAERYEAILGTLRGAPHGFEGIDLELRGAKNTQSIEARITDIAHDVLEVARDSAMAVSSGAVNSSGWSNSGPSDSLYAEIRQCIAEEAHARIVHSTSLVRSKLNPQARALRTLLFSR